MSEKQKRKRKKENRKKPVESGRQSGGGIAHRVK